MRAWWHIAHGAKEECGTRCALEGHVSCEIDLLHDLSLPMNLRQGWGPSVLGVTALTSTDMGRAVSLDLRVKEHLLTY